MRHKRSNWLHNVLQRTQAEPETSRTCLLCIKVQCPSLSAGTHSSCIQINILLNFRLWKVASNDIQAHLFWDQIKKPDSLQTDLVLKQVAEEFHSLGPGWFPSQSLAGSQESCLSSRVARVDLSSTFHQQADQTELARGRRTDERAAVWQGVPHGPWNKTTEKNEFRVAVFQLYSVTWSSSPACVDTMIMILFCCIFVPSFQQVISLLWLLLQTKHFIQIDQNKSFMTSKNKIKRDLHIVYCESLWIQSISNQIWNISTLLKLLPMLKTWTWTWHPQVIYGWMHVRSTHTKHETHLDAPSPVFIYLFHSYTHHPARIFSRFAKKKTLIFVSLFHRIL